MEIIDVNHALAKLDFLDKKPILVVGILSFAFEDISINQYLNKGLRDSIHSSIWIDIDERILKFDPRVMNKWHGKKILVEGILQKPDSFFGGTGHICLWLASIKATDIVLWKHYKKNQ